MAISANGKVLKIGDWVGFKCDIEQYGNVIEIKGDWVVLECLSGFSGEYIGGQTITEELASDCWLED